MIETEMDSLVLDVISKYNDARRGGASLFHIEYNFPETEPEEILGVLERLVQGGKIVKENYLFYPKGD